MHVAHPLSILAFLLFLAILNDVLTSKNCLVLVRNLATDALVKGLALLFNFHLNVEASQNGKMHYKLLL
jgi:hypothetical protein